MAINKLNLGIKIPCVQGEYSPSLLTYTTQLRPSYLQKVIGYDPRSTNWSKLASDLQAIYRTLQRPTHKQRRESIDGYIEDRIGPQATYIGAFPGISIAVQNPAVFRPYDANRDDLAGVGYLDFDLESTNVKIVIDGLGRITGALQKVDEAYAGNAVSKAIIESFMLPVTFFVPTEQHGPLSIDEMGQLFHDFNFRIAEVQPQLALALDQSDIYIRLTNKLAVESKGIVAAGGMASRVRSVGGKSTELVTQINLHRAVRGAMEGHSFQESNLNEINNPNLTRETFHENLAALVVYFDELAAKMGGRFKDRESLHLSAPGWQTLGVIFNDVHYGLHLDEAARAAMVAKLAAFDWSRKNPDWLVNGVLVNAMNKKTGVSEIKLGGAGRSNRAAMLAYVRDKLGLTSMLAARKPVEVTAQAAEPAPAALTPEPVA
jgi:hypothetical protein